MPSGPLLLILVKARSFMVEKEFRRETDNRMGNSASPKTGVNYAAMLDRVGGDETLLREITSIFLEEYPILLTEIRRCIAAADAIGARAGSPFSEGIGLELWRFGGDAVCLHSRSDRDGEGGWTRRRWRCGNWNASSVKLSWNCWRFLRIEIEKSRSPVSLVLTVSSCRNGLLGSKQCVLKLPLSVPSPERGPAFFTPCTVPCRHRFSCPSERRAPSRD